MAIEQNGYKGEKKKEKSDFWFDKMSGSTSMRASK